MGCPGAAVHQRIDGALGAPGTVRLDRAGDDTPGMTAAGAIKSSGSVRPPRHRQKAGVSMTITGMTSSRPIHISAIITTRVDSGKAT